MNKIVKSVPHDLNYAQKQRGVGVFPLFLRKEECLLSCLIMHDEKRNLYDNDQHSKQWLEKNWTLKLWRTSRHILAMLLLLFVHCKRGGALQVASWADCYSRLHQYRTRYCEPEAPTNPIVFAVFFKSMLQPHAVIRKLQKLTQSSQETSTFRPPAQFPLRQAVQKSKNREKCLRGVSRTYNVRLFG